MMTMSTLSIQTMNTIFKWQYNTCYRWGSFYSLSLLAPKPLTFGSQWGQWVSSVCVCVCVCVILSPSLSLSNSSNKWKNWGPVAGLEEWGGMYMPGPQWLSSLSELLLCSCSFPALPCSLRVMATCFQEASQASREERSSQCALCVPVTLRKLETGFLPVCLLQ
jgi:hypothetical protein